MKKLQVLMLILVAGNCVRASESHSFSDKMRETISEIEQVSNSFSDKVNEQRCMKAVLSLNFGTVFMIDNVECLTPIEIYTGLAYILQQTHATKSKMMDLDYKPDSAATFYEEIGFYEDEASKQDYIARTAQSLIDSNQYNQSLPQTDLLPTIIQGLTRSADVNNSKRDLLKLIQGGDLLTGKSIPLPYSRMNSAEIALQLQQKAHNTTDVTEKAKYQDVSQFLRKYTFAVDQEKRSELIKSFADRFVECDLAEMRF